MKMYKSVNEHINSFPKEKQEILEELRQTIRDLCPDAIEAITYGIPTFKLNGKNLVHFAGYEKHIGFYPSPNGMREFAQDLKPYATGKGTAQFSWDKPLPIELIKRIVKFRKEEIEMKR